MKQKKTFFLKRRSLFREPDWRDHSLVAAQRIFLCVIILTLVASHVSGRDSKIVVHLLVFWLDLEEKSIEFGRIRRFFCARLFSR